MAEEQEILLSKFWELIGNKEMSEFKELIESKKEYIDNLRNLGDNWSSDSVSKAPTIEVLELTKEILDYIFKLTEVTPIKIPKLVMIPIPKGGFELKLEYDNNNNTTTTTIIFVTVHNDMSMFLYHFHEYEYLCKNYHLTIDNWKQQLMKVLKDFS